jgi:hypothetical protein
VREERAEHIITYQGQPAAVLLLLDADRIEAELMSVSRRAVLRGCDAVYVAAADQHGATLVTLG